MYEHITSYQRQKQLASLTASLLAKFNQTTIDKLTLLADLRDEKRNLEEIQMHNDCIDIRPNYDRHYEKQIETASDLRITLTLQPSRQVPNLRIEFNPNKFNPTGTLWYLLLPMLKNKRLTRIDYAIDYCQDMSAFQWTTETPRATNIFYSPSGAVETVYLGKRTSSDQYRIYDKAKEQCIEVTEPWWRIEHEFKLSKGQTYLGIHPFANLIGWKPDTFTGNFIDDLVLTELHTERKSWSRLSPYKRKYYRSLIKDHARVVHPKVHPVTTFQNDKSELEAFFDALLS